MKINSTSWNVEQHYTEIKEEDSTKGSQKQNGKHIQAQLPKSLNSKSVIESSQNLSRQNLNFQQIDPTDSVKARR